ncbi:unnamed protein product [Larinioides sclopetarius]|uniref:Uncharacterized protein n=1 Tax=Larinioides sclopetarius TaxID=280406 RepID=A0AAV2AB22_9ARAC
MVEFTHSCSYVFWKYITRLLPFKVCFNMCWRKLFFILYNLQFIVLLSCIILNFKQK